MSAFTPARAGAKKNRMRTYAYAIVYVGVGAIVLLLLVGIAQMRQLAGDNARSIALIEDCTIEGGDCYTQSKRGTAEVVSVLNDFTVYVVACADRDGAQSAARIKACAIKEARKAQR